MSFSTLISPVIIGIVGIYVARRVFYSAKPNLLPPGPKGLPFIGNLFQWPTEKAWEVYTTWGKMYGDIVYVNLAGQPVVILNDPKIAQELFDHRSINYSDRPSTMYMACELVRWKNMVTFMSYGTSMREHRDLITRAIGSNASVVRHAQMEQVEAQNFVRRILDGTESLIESARKFSGSVILHIALGYQVQEGDDPFVNLANKAMHDFGETTVPGRYIIDAFPALDLLPTWFPGLQYRRVAKEMIKTQDDFLNKPYEYVQNQLAAGTARPSFVANQIDGIDITPEMELRVKWVTAALYGGGADTTVSAICSFFLAMTLFPDVQRRAQEEIDANLGSHTIPTLDDRSRLPYVDALVLEVLRWGQAVPQGVAHLSRRDDTYNGYHIPAGTIIVPNIWKYAHDPHVYSAPMNFDPSRFLKTSTKEAEPDPKSYVFGYGRRICPGRVLAEHSLWILFATSLATTTISKKIGDDGLPVTPKVEYLGHLITHPKEFPCIINPRSTNTRAMMHDALQIID